MTGWTILGYFLDSHLSKVKGRQPKRPGLKQQDNAPEKSRDAHRGGFRRRGACRFQPRRSSTLRSYQ